MHSESPRWSLFGRISFRIVFIYLFLNFNPLAKYLPGIFAPLTFFLNEHLFHIRPQLNQIGNGSGDTSFAWASIFTYMLLAVTGGLLWSAIDRRKANYVDWNYWLCLILRYSLAGISFSYGISKVFALQMRFPSMSELATPLGDYLPMRLSWMFIGYSEPYQIFSGIAEVLVGLLLLWRRTALLGAILAVGVFANVVMLNFSYDIPVKIDSFHLLIVSLFLVWQERERLFAFFVQNKVALPSSFYEKSWPKKWQRFLRIGVKVLFFFLYFVQHIYYDYNSFIERKTSSTMVVGPVDPGIYHVELFVTNGDTLPESMTESRRWGDVIFDYNGEGSLAANDSSLFMNYGRAYFIYQTDSLGKEMEWRSMGQRQATFSMDFPSEDRMILSGTKGQDSLHVVLRKLERHFPLAERQFHWINESSR